MKVINFIFFMFFIASNLCSQRTFLKGIITEKTSKAKPLENVEVSADFAKSAITDFEGKFELEFYSKPPGTKVHLIIKYKDWEVVNEDDANLNLPLNPEKQILRLYMIPENLLSEKRMEFYNKSKENIELRYKKELIKIKRKNSDLIAKISNLKKEKENALITAYNLADRFAKIDFDNTSETQKKAFNAFEKGNIDEALKILSDANPLAKAEAAKKERDKWTNTKIIVDSAIQLQDSIIKVQVEQLFFQAYLLEISYKTDLAKEKYKEAASFDSTAFFITYFYAKILANTGEYKGSIKWYKKSIENAKNESDLYEASIYLGNVYDIINQLDSAKKYYEICLNLANQSKNKNISTVKFFYSLINLGNILDEQENYAASITCYREVINLATEDTAKNYRILNDCFLNLGIAYRHVKKYDLAKLYIDSSLKYFLLQDSTSSDIKVMLAECYLNLASMLNGAKAITLLNKGYTEVNSLKKLNYQSIPLQLAFLLNFGIEYQKMFKIESSKVYVDKILAINDSLFDNSELFKYLQPLTILIQKLVHYYSWKYNFDSAEYYIRREIVLYKILIDNGNHDYNASLLDCYNAMFISSFRRHNKQDLMSYAKLAVKLYQNIDEKLAPIYKNSYLAELKYIKENEPNK